jgi:hypothetical protein
MIWEPQPKVTVYRYRVLDPETGYDKIARRMGTKKYISSVNGTVIERSDIEVEPSKVDTSGKTELNFMP